jgi:hypothetical protein
MSVDRNIRQKFRPREEFWFASPDVVHALTAKSFVGTTGRGTWDGKQGTGFCPCHHDRNPSLRFAWKDDYSGTAICCQAGCTWEILSGWFRKQGYWLNRVQPKAKPTRGAKKPITVEVSIAFMALSVNETRIYRVIKEWKNPSYDDFVAAGVRRESIPKGVLVLGGLGLIRATLTRGRFGYERNAYGLCDDWQALEPASAKDRKAAVQRAKDVAALLRLGRERRNKPMPPMGRGVPEIDESALPDWPEKASGGVPEIEELGVPARGTGNGTPSLRVGRNLSYESPYGGEVQPPRSKTEDEGERTVEGGGPRQTPPGDHKAVPFIDRAAIGVLRLCFEDGVMLDPDQERVKDERLIPQGLIEAGVDDDGCRWERLTAKGERLLRRGAA